MDEENQANTLVSVAPLPQEPLDKPTVNRESPPENGTSPSPTTNGHSAGGTPVADTEMWIIFSPPLLWHIHTGPSPCRHRCYCRGRFRLPSSFFFLNIQCIYMDLSIPVMSNFPFMIILYMLQDPIFFWRFLKLGYDVYMHKHKNGIPKNPIKTKMLKSIQTHGHQLWSTWSYDHNSNAHNVKSWGSLCFQVNKRNLLSSNDLA